MLQGLLKKIGNKYILLIAAYAAWILVFRLMCLSFVVYFLSRAGHPATFEEINEAFGNNEIPFIGLSAACFVLLLKGLSPLIDKSTPQGSPLSVSFSEIRARYLPGFFQGTMLALGIVGAFLFMGCLRYVGFFVQIEDAGLAVLGIVFRIGALLAMGFCEEYLFRFATPSNELGLPAITARAGIFALLYCVVKLAQFDLSWMHFATLFLFSLALTARRVREGSFLSGAGFWSAVLIVFHPIFSLPILGSDFSGIFLLKYQPQALVPAAISGGAGGPLASLAFQAVLLIETVRGWLLPW